MGKIKNIKKRIKRLRFNYKNSKRKGNQKNFEQMITLYFVLLSRQFDFVRFVILFGFGFFCQIFCCVIILFIFCLNYILNDFVKENLPQSPFWNIPLFVYHLLNMPLFFNINLFVTFFLYL